MKKWSKIIFILQLLGHLLAVQRAFFHARRAYKRVLITVLDADRGNFPGVCLHTAHTVNDPHESGLHFLRRIRSRFLFLNRTLYCINPVLTSPGEIAGTKYHHGQHHAERNDHRTFPVAAFRHPDSADECARKQASQFLKQRTNPTHHSLFLHIFFNIRGSVRDSFF